MVSIGIFVPELRDFRDGLALQRQQFGVLNDAEQDRFRAWDLVPFVIPGSAGGLHFFADAGAHGRILEALDQLGVAAIVRPGRNEGREAVEPCRVRVRIGADFDARAAGLVDMRDDLRHAPPILTARRLQMPDFDRDMSFTANADRFVDGGNDGIAFAAHMRGVDAAELRAFGRQSDQFFGGGIGRRRVLQRSGHAHRAVAHGIAHQRFHAIEFGGGGRAVAIADHCPAHLRRA